jgi:hypothetical protein
VRALVDGDAVRHGKAVADVPGGQGAALIQPQEAGPRRFLFDDQSHVVEPAAKAGRDGLESLLHQSVELAG